MKNKFNHKKLEAQKQDKERLAQGKHQQQAQVKKENKKQQESHAQQQEEEE